MSGEIHRKTSVAVANNTLTLDNLRDLTVGRKHNLGTLKLVKDSQGNITGLKCSKHHVSAVYISPSQKLSDAQELRDELVRVVERKLNEVFDLSRDEFRNLPQSRIDDINRKREVLLARLKDSYMSIEHNTGFLGKRIVDGVQRSAIGTVVSLLDGLDALWPDKLLAYDVDSIFKIMSRGGVEGSLYLDRFHEAGEERDRACDRVSNARYEDLLAYGNEFVRDCFQTVREIGDDPNAGQGENPKLKAINDELNAYGFKVLHFNDRGRLEFPPCPNNRRRESEYKKDLESDFRKLFNAAILTWRCRILNNVLGGNLSHEGVLAVLHKFVVNLDNVEESHAPAPDADRPQKIVDESAPEPEYEFEDFPAPDGALEIDGRPIYDLGIENGPAPEAADADLPNPGN